MNISPFAGKPAESSMLVNVPRLVTAYYTESTDASVADAQEAILQKLLPKQIKSSELGGEKITAKLTTAPGNGVEIGSLKVTTENGWLAARPSGTENIYKVYAESFQGQDHLRRIIDEALIIVNDALA